MARHFQAKLDLFGADKLARNITQADLGDDDLECLYAGYEQFLSARDRAGRIIWIQVAHPNHSKQSERSKVTCSVKRETFDVMQRIADLTLL